MKNPFSIKKELTEQEVNKGLRMYVLDGICSTGLGTLQGGVYLTAFAIVLGASQKQIGFIASIAFLSQLMQLPGLFLVSKYPKRKLITVVASSLAKLFWIPIILMPIFKDAGVNFLLTFLFIAAMFGAIPGPAWNSLLRDLLPPDKMGSINGRKILLSTAIALILTLSGGYFVDWWKASHPDKEIISYSILFGVGFIFAIFSIVSMMRIPEPLSTATKVPLRKLLSSPIKDTNFRMLIIFLAVWTFAVNMSGPFFLVYMLDRLEISLFLVTILVVASQFSNILFLKIWGKIADKFSNKSVLSVSGPLFLLIILLWTFIATPEPHKFTIPLLFVIHFLTGIAVAGVTLGTANIALKLSPKGQAHGYMTVVGLSSSVMGAIAPIIGGFLADYFIRMQLDLPLVFSFDADKFSLPILSLRGLEFLFLVTFIIGIYAMHRLALVKEIGEVENRKVIDELTESIMLPLKSISVVEGIQRIAIMPISGMMHLAGKVSNKRKKNISPTKPTQK